MLDINEIISIYFVFLFVFSLVSRRIHFKKISTLIISAFLWSLQLLLSSFAVLNVSGGDYVVYLRFFKGCLDSVRKCWLISSFEPIFTLKTTILSSIFQYDPHTVWLILSSIASFFYLYSIWLIFRSFSLSYNKIISAYSLINLYLFTNFTTLAIRFNLSFSLMTVAVALIITSRISLRSFAYISLALFSSLFTHYQSMFIAPFLFMLASCKLRSLQLFSPPEINLETFLSRISLRLKKFYACVFLGFIIASAIIFPFLSSLLLLIGKSYYLIDYQSSTMGLRSIVEALIILFIVLIPSQRNLLKGIATYRLKSVRFVDSLFLFSIFSVFLSYLALFLFSVDGFSRQVQACFVLAIICSYLYQNKSYYIYNCSYFLLPTYALMISLYTLAVDVSFG